MPGLCGAGAGTALLQEPPPLYSGGSVPAGGGREESARQGFNRVMRAAPWRFCIVSVPGNLARKTPAGATVEEVIAGLAQLLLVREKSCVALESFSRSPAAGGPVKSYSLSHLVFLIA